MSFALTIQTEELEKAVEKALVEEYPGIAELSEEARKALINAAKTYIRTGIPVRYAFGICKFTGALTRECVMKAATRYTLGILKRAILSELLQTKGALIGLMPIIK